MAQVLSSTSGASATTDTSQTSNANSAVGSLNVDSFLKLMITELQNQDPLNPMDSSQMLDQIAQMRQITSSDKLTSTLNSVLLGQNIASSTNLIGANITGISDDQQKVAGVVSSVSIDNGTPKLHVDLQSTATPSTEKGNLSKGTYSYRVLWKGDDGNQAGIEFSGNDAVSTQSSINDYQSIELANLPETSGPKSVYRTDSSGTGDYRLVGAITDGTQSSYLDTTSDDSRSQTRQTLPFEAVSNAVRKFIVSLSNVGDIKPPGTSGT
jgi:flagellar basal-body rod modification protein FlgD